MAVRGVGSEVKAVVIVQFLSHVGVFAAPWTAYMEQREVLEPGETTCAGQVSTDQLT